MSFFTTSLVSGRGMSVQRQIMDLISENLANVNTVKAEDGEPYKRKIPVISSKQVSLFGDMMTERMKEVVYISEVVRDQAPPRQDYDPSHPLADERGYVFKPNINVAVEMVQMMDATRAYEANVAAFNASKNMAAKALQIGV